MKKYIIIKADTNDADYITKKTEITDEQIEQIKPVIAALQVRRDKLNEDRHKNWNRWSPNWETSKYGRLVTPSEMYVKPGILTEEQVQIFDEFVPYGEYGVHTIETVEILVVSEEIQLF